MKVGRYCKGDAVRLFVATEEGLFDWSVFDEPPVPEQLRRAATNAMSSGSSGDFCDAILLMAPFLAANPRFLRCRSAEVGILGADGPLESPVIPRNFVCIGLNYFDHARESGIEIPKKPLLFAKTANALSGHNQPIKVPPESIQIDFEPELAVVIGKVCRDVAADRALDYVAGYTCANDISARDFQFDDGQWYRGKSCDGFGPLGPWLVTPDELPDPHHLRIQLRLNGAVMQNSSTSELIFKVPDLIAFISRSITLMPGDIISTGTPPGVGFARKPPVFLRAGDTVDVEIEGLGVLTNRVA